MECKSLFLKRKDYLRDLEEYLMDEEDEELADHFQSLISSKKNEKKLYFAISKEQLLDFFKVENKL